jgi:hypothetical protein
MSNNGKNIQKWEYLIGRLYEDGRIELGGKSAMIDQLGAGGWEMIDCTWFEDKQSKAAHAIAVFKRSTTTVRIGRTEDAFGVSYIDRAEK